MYVYIKIILSPTLFFCFQKFDIKRLMRKTVLNLRKYKKRNLLEVYEEQVERGEVERKIQSQIGKVTAYFLMFNCSRPPHANAQEKKLVSNWLVKQLPEAGPFVS